MRVQEAMEFGDDKEGLSRDEYDAFINALPQNFQDRFAHIKFEEIAGDDEILDMDEFVKLADQFAVENAGDKAA